MPTIDSLHFDTTGWQPGEGTEETLTWTNEQGDDLSLHFFAIPPDIPLPLTDISGLRNFYREGVTQAGGALVSMDVISLDDLDSIRLLLKSPQQPTGMTYIGSLTLPFADFSYVLRVESPESRITGVREAVLASQFMEARHKVGKMMVEMDEEGRIIGWSQDPYDPSFTAPVLRSLADDEKYDAMFPDHPLSRVRRCLQRLEATITVDPQVRKAKPFSGPQPV